jgi:hypothetical protein
MREIATVQSMNWVAISVPPVADLQIAVALHPPRPMSP